jgi:hypothetical protein
MLFCFSLIGFLHSISPFIETTEEENTIVKALTAFMSDQIFAIGPIFDAAELSLLAEFHNDVMSTPADQLLLALDYVKSKALEGKPYRTSDIPKVSLELRKFLSSSKDEQYRVLEAERLRLKALAEAEEKRRRLAEQRVASLEETQLDAQAGRKQAHFQQLKFRGLLAVLGIAAGIGLWVNCHTLAVWFTTTYPVISNWISLNVVQTIFSGIGALLFAWPAFSFVLATNIRVELRSAILVIVAAVVLALSNLLSESRLSLWANSFGVATPIALLVIIMWHNSRR